MEQRDVKTSVNLSCVFTLEENTKMPESFEGIEGPVTSDTIRAVIFPWEICEPRFNRNESNVPF